MQDDLNVFSDVRPIQYQPDVQNQQRKREIWPEGHHYIARVLEQNFEKLSTKELARKTGLDRNTIRRVRRGERVQPKTRLKLLKVASK
jgi:response regulator of citrate/malate metabolism